MKSVQIIVDTVIIVHPTKLHTVASEAQRAQLVSYYILLYIKGAEKSEIRGWHQSEWFVLGLTSPPRVTQHLHANSTHQHYYLLHYIH